MSMLLHRIMMAYTCWMCLGVGTECVSCRPPDEQRNRS